MLISIIVPVYKVEPYLRECIDSILAQTYRDFELILVDDGSPDRCGAICDEYAAQDSRIRVVHQENGGLSAARNTGLEIAAGDYITFVDSDDVVHPEYLSFLFEILCKTGADISICRFLRYSGETPAAEPCEIAISAVMTGRESCYALYGDEAVVYTTAWGKLYRRKLFEGVRYPVGRIHEDEATTYKLLYQANKVAVLENELYLYRQNLDSIMNTRFSEKRYHALTAFEERIAFFREQGEHELAKMGKQVLPVAVAKMTIMAENAGVQLPAQYRMSVHRALRIIRKTSPDNNYIYYLAMVHPNWLLPHAYLRKIKKILHIPCK